MRWIWLLDSRGCLPLRHMCMRHIVSHRRCFSCLRHTSLRNLCTLRRSRLRVPRRRRFSRLRLRQVRVRRRRRDGTTKSAAPRMGRCRGSRCRGSGSALFRSFVIELLSASLVISLLGCLYSLASVQAESSVAAPEKETVAATGARPLRTIPRGGKRLCDTAKWRSKEDRLPMLSCSLFSRVHTAKRLHFLPRSNQEGAQERPHNEKKAFILCAYGPQPDEALNKFMQLST
jgi:hypothetical protein